MDLKDLQSLIRMITKADLSEFKMKTKDIELNIRTKHFQRSGGETALVTTAAPSLAAPSIAPEVPAVEPAPAAAPSATPETSESNLIEVKSPIVGTFYRSSSPDKPAFVKVGDTISQGQVVCIVEAMKLFNEIESEVSGTVVKVLLEDASPVEYDQVLFLVDPAG